MSRFDIFCYGCESHMMNVSLTPKLEKAIREKVESGLYNNASEVIREALRIAHRQEQENDWLKREAAIGYAQLEAGERTRVKSKEEFKILVRGGKNPDDA